MSGRQFVIGMPKTLASYTHVNTLSPKLEHPNLMGPKG